MVSWFPTLFLEGGLDHFMAKVLTDLEGVLLVVGISFEALLLEPRGFYLVGRYPPLSYPWFPQELGLMCSPEIE